jgi:membrane-associated phospholipid phosphatase
MSDATPRLRVAATLSLVGHPFVIVPATIGLLMWPSKAALVIALLMVIAMLAVIARRVKAGQWTDYDVSNPEQRRSFYPMALTVVAASAIASWLLRMPGSLVLGMVSGFVLLAVGAFLTRSTKVSLHMLIGMFCAVIVTAFDIRLGVPLTLLIVTVAWSRVALGRHTPVQVLLGALVGGIVGMAFVALNEAM